ncbi:MAG: hypothetical protein MH204_11930, partial [Fimbriimonadaceae bacterium]|nr:hypothetical protein [Fimbriimonadaceae bacterium]
MDPARRTLTLALARTPGIGGKTVTRCLARLDLLHLQAEEFLRLSEAALIEDFRFPRAAAARWTA